MPFIDYLINNKTLGKNDANEILKEIESEGENLDSVLIRRGVDPNALSRLRGEYSQIPVRKLGEEAIPFEILKYVPEESASYYHFAPIGLSDGVLEIGILDPDDTQGRDAIQFIASKLHIPYKLFIISLPDFERIINQYKGLTGEVNRAVSDLESEMIKARKKSGNYVETIEDISKESIADIKDLKVIKEAPVSKIVATLLRYAIEGSASDIHVEHVGDNVRVRFRIDGTLHTNLVLPTTVHSGIVARIKILSDMKLDEKRIPQDGRFSVKIEGRKVDLRVSTFPAYYGEKVVMRILDAEKGVKTLSQLGLSKENVETIRETIKRPYGMILLTGPTGSGKTTTLYAMLNEVDREKSNVVSLEDPVEYSIPGVSQSQVREEIGYSFANGLRTTLRQDPDIIMVGEIRDKETAQLAIQAALTGHLVLSTLHTNNAIGAIPRLVDMGVDPYLIAPTLIMTIAQRLVKAICPDAKEEVPVDDIIRMRIEKEIGDLPAEFKKPFTSAKFVHKAGSSPTCLVGTKGRIGAFEVLVIDKDVEKMILTNPVEDEIYKIARKKGMLTMKEDAILKSIQGITPFEEMENL